MITRVADGEARKFGMQNLFSALENYMATDRSIVVEGALVDGPTTLVDFQALAKAHHYNFVPIMLTAESKQRRKRKKRKKRLCYTEKARQSLNSRRRIPQI